MLKRYECFAIGEMIAWTLHDGNTMVGQVTEDTRHIPGCNAIFVKRIDGTACVLYLGELPFADTNPRKATADDFNQAVDFFANIGNSDWRPKS